MDRSSLERRLRELSSERRQVASDLAEVGARVARRSRRLFRASLGFGVGGILLAHATAGW